MFGEYRYKYEEWFKYLTSICLNVTDACNLKCKYCFVAQHPNFMDIQVAKDAVDWLHNNMLEKRKLGIYEKCSINFFGGEPMLLYDKIIQPTVEYCEEKYPNDFDFGMTTNGTLLDDEKIKWFSDHRFSLLLSIDGAKDTQDFNRPCQDESKSSFDMVYKNIPTLLQYFPNITFRSTIDQESVEHTFENYIFAEKAGFRNIFMMPNGRERWSQESINILTGEVEKIFGYIQEQYLSGDTPIGCSVIDDTFKDVIDQSKIMVGMNYAPDLNAVKNVMRCGLGTSSGSIGYNGDIYGCQEQDSKGVGASQFYIGNIYDGGIDVKLHDVLLKKYAYSGRNKCENREICYNCFLRTICQRNTCPSSSIDCFNDPSIVAEIHCIWRNALFFNALRVYYYLYSQNIPAFNNYIYNLTNENNNFCNNCQGCNNQNS